MEWYVYVQGLRAGLRGDTDPRECPFEKMTKEWETWQRWHTIGTELFTEMEKSGMLQEILLLLNAVNTLMIAVDELRTAKGQPPAFVGTPEYVDLRNAISKINSRLGEEERTADGKS